MTHKVFLDNEQVSVKEMPRYERENPANSNIAPEGYMTADEWRARCKKNIAEIFRKHEHGLL